MEATANGGPGAASPERTTAIAQAGLCGLAALVSIWRATRTTEADGVVLASAAATLALIALVMAFWSRRWSAAPIGLALLMELTVLLGPVAPPRIVNAIPLMFALGLAVAPFGIAPVRALGSSARKQRVVTVVSLALMAPLGLAYLVGPNIIAPYPDIYVSYVLYGVLMAGTVTLARRRSWWVAAMPFVSLGLFLLMVQVGVALRDWGG